MSPELSTGTETSTNLRPLASTRTTERLQRCTPGRSRILSALVLSTLLCGFWILTHGEARANGPPPPRPRTGSAVIEVADKDSSGTGRTFRMALALPEDGQASQLETHDAAATYRIRISRTWKTASSAIVHLDLRRTEHAVARRRHAGEQITAVALSSLMTVGQTSVVGRVERQDGSRVTITVTLQ